jgi:predicted nucleic acid-binding protein
VEEIPGKRADHKADRWADRKKSAMFEWPFIKKIELVELIAHEAVELARDKGLRPADSIHAASAIKKCDVLQRWDRDFEKVKDLITVEDPQQISPQGSLFAAAPKPEDFKE